ncbi:MAG TPA: response regulator [Lacipirellula sp.]
MVDLNVDDYQPLLASTPLRLFATGDAALRVYEPHVPSLWMINVQLPDMSGIGLLTLIRARRRREIIYLIGDEYRLEDELAARSAGATAYMCKPVCTGWLACHTPRCRSPAIRAGPAPFS